MQAKTILYLGSDPTRFENKKDQVTHLQLFDIVPRAHNLPEIVSVLADWTAYTTIIFTSKHAVQIFHDLLLRHHLSPHCKIEIIAVGKTTAETLQKYGWEASLVAKDERQEGIISCLRILDWNEKNYVLMPRSSSARGAIEQFFLEREIRHQVCDLYDTRSRKVNPFPNLEEFDEIVFTSPSTVISFFEQILKLPTRPILRAIGEVTWQNLRRATMIFTASTEKLRN